MLFFFFQAEDGIRDIGVTGVQTCALPILRPDRASEGAVLEDFGERPRVLEQAVDRGVPGEAFDEGAAGLWVFLARLEERLQHPQVRDEVDQGVAGDVLAGPLAPELALVAQHNRYREVPPRVRLVRASSGQPAALEGVADALAAYRVDHAPRLPDHHDPLGVPFGAPHPHL